MGKKINIAIDGYSSCGKSTLAKSLAKKLNYNYIDTGAMYRAVTLFSIKNNLFDNNQINKFKLIQLLKNIKIDFIFNKKKQSFDTFLNCKNIEKEIRTLEVSNFVSYIAEIKEIRKWLVEQQQKIVLKKGVIMDGRDIGTVVMPNAELKLFITASDDVRSTRRYDELKILYPSITFQKVKKNLLQRDYIDSNREADPLKQAEDSIVINNSNLSITEQLEMILTLAKLRIKN